MLRECSLEDISDGRLYTENDLVRTDTGECVGCKQSCFAMQIISELRCRFQKMQVCLLHLLLQG